MRFVHAEDPAWQAALGRLPHDFYHLPAYAAACAEWEGGVAKAFVYERADALALIPLLMRPVPPGLAPEGPPVYDAVSPYGYASPLFSPDAGEAFVLDALRAFIAEGEREGLVTTFLRLHPLLQPDLPPEPGAAWVVHEHGPTVALDLAEPDDDWFSGISSNHRRNVNRLRRNGFAVRFNEEGDERAFRDIYRATMDRVGAEDGYLFSDAYFDTLKALLGERYLLCAVLDPQGEVAAGGIFTLTEGLGQYHLGGTAPDYLGVAPSKLMFVEVRREMARRGGHVFHLGGGVGAQRDRLFEFKQGFRGRECTFASARFIHSAPQYRALCDRWAALRDTPDPAASTFFPLYRRP